MKKSFNLNGKQFQIRSFGDWFKVFVKVDNRFKHLSWPEEFYESYSGAAYAVLVAADEIGRAKKDA